MFKNQIKVLLLLSLSLCSVSEAEKLLSLAMLATDPRWEGAGQYITVQYSTVIYSTVQYSNLPYIFVQYLGGGHVKTELPHHITQGHIALVTR